MAFELRKIKVAMAQLMKNLKEILGKVVLMLLLHILCQCF